jgi:hypothetical protein
MTKDSIGKVPDKDGMLVVRQEELRKRDEL